MRKTAIIVLASLIHASCSVRETPDVRGSTAVAGKIPVPAIEFSPEHYTCYRAGEMTVDGEITDEEWSAAPWSNLFTDIEGELKPAPLYDTRMKMLWDDSHLYIAAELMEPHIRATLRQRDTVIFHDNDFEVFIDPDGDTHGYYEFEMNAFNTVWDLLLTMPYRDNGRAIDAWDIAGLKSAVKIYGTLNDPSDIDEKWTLEIAFPFAVLEEWGEMPADGTVWRMNFSRVNWKRKTENGRYLKLTDCETGKPLPEYNWLWSPQGLINVHYPEMWGFVQFNSGGGTGKQEPFFMDHDEMVKWELRQLYYAQRALSADKGGYASDAELLEEYGYTPSSSEPHITVTLSGYEAALPDSEGNSIICIDHRGMTWKQAAK